MKTNQAKNNNKKTILRNGFPRRRIRFGLLLSLAGFFMFLLGIRPQIFQLDRSPVIGFIQIAVMLAGLAIICVGGYISLRGLWRSEPLSLAAEIGMRLISTGYVIALFTGLADIFGLGSHPYPEYTPYFGQWQALGVAIAEGIISLGLLLMVPYTHFPKIKAILQNHIDLR